MKYYVITVLILLSAFSLTYANGFGIKIDNPVGDYIANVDADTYSFVSEEPVNFNFMLWNKDRTKGVDFDNVWVSITPEGGFGNIFGAFLGRPDFGGFRMTYVFPKPGNYNILARYGKAGTKGTETMAETTFPITVEAGDVKPLGASSIAEIILALIVGLIIGVSFTFFKKRK